ncbi:F-box and associated interaction domain protein [Medicago truncatula]|uniref:F-box and associated interaction domain protein n=1 Tax=Medicago truncatula TaxID=3880 RepID=G8A2D7_MEDTR|nr:F-box and associated interaction domain protein [Medicago truncatula]
MGDILPVKKLCQSNTPSLPVFIPNELIAEILSFLNVETILQLKCVCKSWKTLVSDPIFVKNHLKKSSQKPHLALICKGCNVATFPLPSLLKNPSITVSSDSFHPYCCWNVVGSCNGLLCVVYISKLITQDFVNQDYWFRFMNPSMRTTSKLLGWFRDNILLDHTKPCPRSGYFKFMFGYDDVKETYKVVAFRVKGHLGKEASLKSELSGTINWLAICKYFRCNYLHKNITHVDQFVIVILDLSTETFKKLLLPQGFDEVPLIEPVLSVLMGCLCFSYDFRKTEFVLWQMKEYGVHENIYLFCILVFKASSCFSMKNL